MMPLHARHTLWANALGVAVISATLFFTIPMPAPAASDVTVQAKSGASQAADVGEPRGGCSSVPPTPCGEVQNNTSDTWVRVSLRWTCDSYYEPLGSSCPQDIRTVAPHSHIGGGNVDVDAFEVPDRCTFWGDKNGANFVVGSGWHRFNNLQTVTISHAECRGT